MRLTSSEYGTAGMVEAFDTNYIVGVREEPRLTEQQFGNFQNLATIRDSKQERARFGRFYYRYGVKSKWFGVSVIMSGSASRDTLRHSLSNR